MKKNVSRKVSKKTAEEGDFELLVVSIVQIHQQAQSFAAKAVNLGLTLRNWLIGRQIEVYERHGSDRTAYGDKLMDNLATRLQQQGWARCERRELYRFRQFYLAYPKIVESLTPQSFVLPHLQPLMAFLPGSVPPIRETVSPESQIVETLSPQFEQSVGPACPAGLRGSPRPVGNGFDKARCDIQQIAHTRFACRRKSFPAERTYGRSSLPGWTSRPVATFVHLRPVPSVSHRNPPYLMISRLAGTQPMAATRFACRRKSFPAERTYFRSRHARRTG